MSDTSFQDSIRMYLAGDFDAAIATLLDVAERSPHGPSLYLLGKILVETGRPDEAMQYLQLASKVDPSDYDSLLELANAFYETGKTEEAEKIWSRAISLDPTHPKAYNSLAVSYFERDQFADAVKFFTDGIQNSVSIFLPLLKGRALTLMQLENFEDAITDLDVCIGMEPDITVFYWYRSQCRLQLNLRDSAYRDAETCIANDPEDSDYITQLQLCKIALDRPSNWTEESKGSRI